MVGIRSRSRRRRRPAARPCRQVGAPDSRIQPPNLSISETLDEVIVHHADCLHVRINDGRTNEAESPLFEILAKRVRFSRGSWNLPHCLPPVEFGSSIDEPPAISVKTFQLFLNCKKRTSV